MTGKTPPSTRPAAPPRRVGLISLGCAKNLVDAEIMLGSLLRDGLEIVNDPTQADALIVNTCSFIDAAQEESVDAILESTALRAQRRPDQAVIVSGCLPQRFRDDLPKLLPEVDAFMGIDQIEQVGEIVHRAVTDRARKQAELQPAPPRPTARTPGKSKPTEHSLDSARVKRQIADLEATAADGNPEPSEPSRRGTEALAPTRKTVTSTSRSPAPVPDVNAPVGASASAAAPVAVHVRPNYIPHWDTPRFRLTPRHFAYVKIAEGCNHPCSFCIIPRMRGSHRSRAQEDIVEEARRLLADGARELNLISQDSTYYGLDRRPRASRAIASPERFTAATRSLPADATTLGTLLRALNRLPGDFWIRLLYTHPAHWTDELIATIADCPKVARYVDMPLQHIHDDLLARMRRETNGQYIRNLIARIRAGIPGIALRTTFIVGFPGETRQHFETLLDFIRDTRFERLGVFTYSQEEGTVAGRMSGQVPPRTRARRRERAMAVQHAVARELSAGAVGRELKVLVEGQAHDRQLTQANIFSWEHGHIREADSASPPDAPPRTPPRRGYLVARGEADAPDIDGRIYIRGRLPIGEFARVRVVGHTDYDLIAEPV